MNLHYKKLCDSAFYYHTHNDLKKAEEIYKQLLKINPEDINVLNLFAQLNFAIKNYDIALNIFKKIYDKTNLNEIQMNIGKVYMAQGNYELAINSFKMLKHQDNTSFRLLASAYTKLNLNDDAINTYENIIKNHTPSFSDYYNLSILYSLTKDRENSLKYALSAYSLNNGDIDVNLHLASLYESFSDWVNAKKHLLNILKAKNSDIDILYRLGILYKKLNNDEAAVECFNRILNINPDNKEALLNIAFIYKNHDKNVSVEILNKLCSMYPSDDSMLLYLYILYESMMNYEQCRIIAEKLIILKPDESFYYSILGDALIGTYKYEESLKMYEKAFELNNNDVYSHLQIAYIYSVSNRAEEALDIILKYIDDDSVKMDYTYIQCREKNLQNVRDYFYRCHTKEFNKNENDNKAKRFFYKLNIDKKYSMNEEGFSEFKKIQHNSTEELITRYRKKDWKAEDISGKNLLVYSAHGAGDIIMCSRYLKTLQSMVSNLIIQMPDSLVDIYKYNFPDIKVYSKSEFISDDMFDYAVSYMCILCNLNIDLHKLEGTPYLSIDENIVKEKSKLEVFNTNKKKVGIYWQGNPTVLLNRSVKLEKFLPLFDIKDIQFYSFQISKIDSDSENLKKELPLIDLSKYIKTYYDTAALLKNIDVLITIDSSIAHLAGALGVKTYMLLSYATEWRWFYDTKTTPWYNSVEIFKQKKSCDWEEVFKRVKNGLEI